MGAGPGRIPGVGAGDRERRGRDPRAEQALSGATRALEPKAMAAARLPEIVSGLDLDADPHTFEDLLENEDWWAPYRTEFPLSGLVTASGALAMIMGTLGGSPNAPATGLAGQSPAATHAIVFLGFAREGVAQQGGCCWPPSSGRAPPG